MLDGQNTLVDHLVKIIQAIQIGRTTGSLIATRGEEASYELGTLVFLNGRVVQARAGRREGREAFNWLSTWGKCRYTFVFSITSDTNLHSTEQFSEGETQSQNRIRHVKLLPLGQAQRADRGKPYPHAGRYESRTDSSLGGYQHQFMQAEDQASPGISKQVNDTVPYRSKPLEYSLQVLSKKSLSRMHRNVFLLVDGARKVRDLMRLLKLNENQVLALLYDLQDTGVISLPIPLSL